MKQLAIRKYYASFETDSESIQNSSFDEKLDTVYDEIKKVLEKHGLKMLESEGVYLPFKKLSLCNCEKCGHYMINRDENPTKFDDNGLYDDLTFIIFDGGTHEGKNLCEECLPHEHKWGHYS